MEFGGFITLLNLRYPVFFFFKRQWWFVLMRINALYMVLCFLTQRKLWKHSPFAPVDSVDQILDTSPQFQSGTFWGFDVYLIVSCPPACFALNHFIGSAALKSMIRRTKIMVCDYWWLNQKLQRVAYEKLSIPDPWAVKDIQRPPLMHQLISHVLYVYNIYQHYGTFVG